MVHFILVVYGISISCALLLLVSLILSGPQSVTERAEYERNKFNKRDD